MPLEPTPSISDEAERRLSAAAPTEVSGQRAATERLAYTVEEAATLLGWP